MTVNLPEGYRVAPTNELIESRLGDSGQALVLESMDDRVGTPGGPAPHTITVTYFEHEPVAVEDALGVDALSDPQRIEVGGSTGWSNEYSITARTPDGATPLSVPVSNLLISVDETHGLSLLGEGVGVDQLVDVAESLEVR